jgi:hypothetical protein
MARGINLSFLADVRDLLRGTTSVQQSLEDVGGALTDVVTDSAKAQEAMSADFAKIAADANASADKVASGYDTSATKAGHSTASIKEGFKGTGDELKQEGLAGAAAFDGSMSSAADSAQAFSSVALASFGPLGVALGVAAAAGFGAFRAQAEKAKEATKAYVQAVIDGNGKVEDSFRVTQVATKAAAGDLQQAAKDADTLGLSFEDLIRAQDGQAGSIALLRAKRLELQNTEAAEVFQMKGLSQASIEASAALGRQESAAGIASKGMEQGAVAADLNARALEALGIKSDDTADATDNLTDSVKESTQSLLDARGAARDYQQALDDATASLKENGRTLDIHTQKGRDNQAALDDVARAALADGEVRRSERQHYIDLAEAMGLAGDKAERLATKLGLIPKDTTATVKVTLDPHALRKAAAAEGLRWDES